ncbi:MAG: hypothetical protein AB8E15_04150 [Bdellovibrionales bacterium]
MMKFLVLIVLSLSVAKPAMSANITKKKKKKIYLKLEPSDIFDKGDRLFVFDKKNKKRGLIIIRKVKGNKALAILKKGKARKGWKAYLKGQSKPGKAVAKKKRMGKKKQSKANSGKREAWRWGVAGGINLINMDITLSDGEVVATTGTTISALVTLQWNLHSNWVLLGRSGYMGFGTEGTAVGGKCQNDGVDTTQCVTDIAYLSNEGYIQYYFNEGPSRYWGGFGGNMVFPLTKSSTALTESEIALDSYLAFAFGYDLSVSDGREVPMSIEFQTPLQPSTGVDRFIITTRVGYRW